MTAGPGEVAPPPLPRLHIRRPLPWRVCFAHIHKYQEPARSTLPSSSPGVCVCSACLHDDRSVSGPPSKRTSDAAREFAPLRGRVRCGFVLKHRPVGPMFQRDDVCLGATRLDVRCHLSQTVGQLGGSEEELLRPVWTCLAPGCHKTSVHPVNPAFYIVPGVVPSTEGCQRPCIHPRCPSEYHPACEDQVDNIGSQRTMRNHP